MQSFGPANPALCKHTKEILGIDTNTTEITGEPHRNCCTMSVMLVALFVIIISLAMLHCVNHKNQHTHDVCQPAMSVCVWTEEGVGG